MWGKPGHPTRFCDIVLRIARRRFVSWAEIEGPILEWYCRKWNYPDQLIRQHGIQRQLRPFYSRLGGVLGRIVANGWWDSSVHRHRALYCELKDGKRVDRQYCRWCGVGINPVANGKLKRRLTCKHPVCHGLERWADWNPVGKATPQWPMRSRWAISRELWPLVAMTSFLMSEIERLRPRKRRAA